MFRKMSQETTERERKKERKKERRKGRKEKKKEKKKRWGAWMAQSVKHPTSAQVMISQSVNSISTSGSVLTAQSLEPASDSVSPSL